MSRTHDVGFWTRQVQEQRTWMDSCGGSLLGYVARYGSRDDVQHYGMGGEAIYAADAAELRRREQRLELAQKLAEKRRAK